MSLSLLSDVLGPLPFALREQVEGYARSIDEAAEDIFAHVGVPFDETLRDRLVFLVGIRRLWTITNSQFAILDNSLSLVAQHRVEGFAVGSHRLTKQSEDYRLLRQLRQALLSKLHELQLEEFALAGSVGDILVMLAEGTDGHR